MQKTSKDWEYVYSDHFRMSGVYWALTALALLPGQPISSFMAEDDVVAWVTTCKKQDGSFGHNEYHDGCLLATLSAVQIMVLLGRSSDLDADGIAACACCSDLCRPCATQQPPLALLYNRLTHVIIRCWPYDPNLLPVLAR